MNVARALLRTAAWLVPPGERSEWCAEWSAELAYAPPGQATRFVLGAFPDAACLLARRARTTGLRGPWACLILLTLACATGGLWVSLLPRAQAGIFGPVPLAHLVNLGVAWMLLPCTGVLAGDSHAGRPPRWWAFLAAKILLVAVASFLASFAVSALFSRTGAQPHAALAGYILGFRWALVDQRRRCPRCLRRLSNPVRIGQPSGILLDWYGTELLCERGHGALYLPEIPASSSCSTRWVAFDASWQELFS